MTPASDHDDPATESGPVKALTRREMMGTLIAAGVAVALPRGGSADDPAGTITRSHASAPVRIAGTAVVIRTVTLDPQSLGPGEDLAG